MNKLFYIFLDVDGVLNDEKYVMKCYERHHKPMHMNHVPFDPSCLLNLYRFVNALEARDYTVKIILSSTWRLHEVDYEIVNARLAEYGLSLHDKTIFLDGIRGLEIQQYLYMNETPSDFVILDDDINDIIPYYPDNLVRTNFMNGFDEDKLKEALNKFIYSRGDI